MEVRNNRPGRREPGGQESENRTDNRYNLRSGLPITVPGNRITGPKTSKRNQKWIFGNPIASSRSSRIIQQALPGSSRPRQQPATVVYPPCVTENIRNLLSRPAGAGGYADTQSQPNVQHFTPAPGMTLNRQASRPPWLQSSASQALRAGRAASKQASLLKFAVFPVNANSVCSVSS